MRLMYWCLQHQVTAVTLGCSLSLFLSLSLSLSLFFSLSQQIFVLVLLVTALCDLVYSIIQGRNSVVTVAQFQYVTPITIIVTMVT